MSSLSADPPTAIDPERLEKLVGLFHLRWKIPLLAQLHQNPAFGRVAALARRLDVGRATVSRTLRALADEGAVTVNPGYGHPLRPEYVLTELGAELGPWCRDFAEAIRRRPDLPRLAYQKWSMATLHLVAGKRRRFSEIEDGLPAITARALTQTLKQLAEAGLLRRTVSDGFPVRVEYRPTPRGRDLAAVLGAFFA